MRSGPRAPWGRGTEPHLTLRRRRGVRHGWGFTARALRGGCVLGLSRLGNVQEGNVPERGKAALSRTPVLSKSISLLFLTSGRVSRCLRSPEVSWGPVSSLTTPLPSGHRRSSSASASITALGPQSAPGARAPLPGRHRRCHAVRETPSRPERPRGRPRVRHNAPSPGRGLCLSAGSCARGFGDLNWELAQRPSARSEVTRGPRRPRTRRAGVRPRLCPRHGRRSSRPLSSTGDPCPLPREQRGLRALFLGFLFLGAPGSPGLRPGSGLVEPEAPLPPRC